MMSTSAISIGILIFVLLVMIIYAIAMFELYKKDAFIFTPYKQPSPPPNTFRPLGTITPLTQEEINQRNEIIYSSTGTAT